MAEFELANIRQYINGNGELVVEDQNSGTKHTFSVDGASIASDVVRQSDFDGQLPSSVESGGANEMDVGDLAGDLADPQDPKTHSNTSHSTNYSPQSHDHSGGAINPDLIAGVTIVHPGDNLQSRIDATPTGGVLFFAHGDHDVATMGTGVIDSPLTVMMSGGETPGDSDSTPNREGAQLVNKGSDAVAGPILKIDDTTQTNGSHLKGAHLEHPTIIHEGTGPAIEIADAPHTTIHNPMLEGRNTGETAIKMSSSDMSWGVQIYGGRIWRFTKYGIDDRSIGGMKYLIGTRVGLDASVAGSVGARLNGGWYVNAELGGETGAHVTDSNCLIRPYLENVGDGIVIGPSSEVSSNVSGVLVWGGRCYGHSGNFVVFDYAGQCALKDPLQLSNGSTAGTAVKWTANAVRCGIEASFGKIKNSNWDIASGAFEPMVNFDQLYRTNGTARGGINQPVEGMHVWATDHGRPAYYDGSAWVLADGTSA